MYQMEVTFLVLGSKSPVNTRTVHRHSQWSEQIERQLILKYFFFELIAQLTCDNVLFLHSKCTSASALRTHDHNAYINDSI